MIREASGGRGCGTRRDADRRGSITVIGSACGALLLCLAAFAAAPVQGGPLPSQLFPPDNWWNVDISTAPVDPNSASFINFINSGTVKRMHPDCGGDVSPGSNEIYGFPYIVVDGSQPKKAVSFQYADESDGVDHTTGQSYPFYPIPDEAITQPHWIEGGWPGNIDRRDTDRHVLIVDRDNQYLYELWNVYYDGSRWQAGSGAFFDMKTNNRRPDGWTSADAAGLAILPGLMRYDEVSGSDEIHHAFRVTVRATNGYVYPASHKAGSNPLALPMGARLRLKAGTDISKFTPELQKIFRAMKKYGLIVADNGTDMYVSGTYDTRWNNDVLNPAFSSLTANDFDVVQLGYQPPSGPLESIYFPHLAIGGGYTTVFALTNTGADTASGSLTLTDQHGSPLAVSIGGISGSVFPISIPSGGIRILTAGARSAADPTRAGWAWLQSAGGSLDGVATFRYSRGGVLLAAAGVLASQPADSATIPVDNDSSLERFTGVALANPGDQEIRVRIEIIDSNGNLAESVSPDNLNPLGAGGQVATFIHQLVPATLQFRGSMVLMTGGGGQFVATALLQDRGMLSAIPVVKGKPAGVP
jgi:hypothetical protein